MAIQTDYIHHNGGSSSIWSCSDDLALDSKGSISLGRYENETLVWEKYSVFTHNRFQEEIEKLKAPGLVAQKKAYFEQHYKKTTSTSKALQAKEYQATTQKDETCNPVNACRIRVTDDHNNEQRGGSVNRLEQESERNMERDSIGVKQASVEKDSPLSPSIRRCSDISLRVRVSRIECRLKKLSPVPKPKWSISSPKSKMEHRIRKDVVKPFEKPKRAPLMEITREVVDDCHVSSKSIIPKAARNIKSDQFSSVGQQKELECSTKNTGALLTKNKTVSLSASTTTGSLINGCSSSKSLAEKSTTSSTNSKETTNTVNLRKLSVDKRTSGVGVGNKSQELSSHHTRSNS